MFWQGVSKLVQRALDINIKLYDLDIILGLPGEEDIFRITNFCIPYGKKYIFDCRINDNIVSIDYNVIYSHSWSTIQHSAHTNKKYIGEKKKKKKAKI